jgi:hypothetical protein
MKKINNCWWLSQEEISSIEKAKSAAFSNVAMDEKSLDISKQMNSDADVFNPVNPDTGWRSSDIDLLQNPNTDPRLVNSIAGRFARLQEPSNDGISDDDLESSVIDRDFQPSDSVGLATALSSELDAQRLASLQDSQKDSVVVESSKSD